MKLETTCTIRTPTPALSQPYLKRRRGEYRILSEGRLQEPTNPLKPNNIQHIHKLNNQARQSKLTPINLDVGPIAVYGRPTSCRPNLEGAPALGKTIPLSSFLKATRIAARWPPCTVCPPAIHSLTQPPFWLDSILRRHYTCLFISRPRAVLSHHTLDSRRPPVLGGPSRTTDMIQ